MTQPLSTFSTDLALTLRANWASISREKGNPGKGPKKAMDLATAVYQNTLHSSCPFVVIGLNEIRKDADIARNVGLITGRVPKKRNEDIGGYEAVLGEPQWSTLINDMFIIGAINGGKVVHTTHSEIPADRIWDESGKVLASFGRELAILRIAKYQFFRAAHFDQIILRPECTEIQPNLSYSDIVKALRTVKSEAVAFELIFGEKKEY